MSDPIYKKNFVSEAVLRVDFAKVQSINSDTLKALHSNLKREDAEFKEQTVTEYKLQIEKDNQQLKIANVGKLGTYDLVKDRAKYIFDHEKFLLTTGQYVRFSTFYELFKTGYGLMNDLTKAEEYKRIGLRYINIINLDDISGEVRWRDYINQKYIADYSDLQGDFPNATLRRNMGLYVMKEGDYLINLQVGIWNKNYPGIVTDKEFIVDIDCFIDNVTLDSNDVISYPPKMNIMACRYFETVITDNLRTLMKGE